MDPFPELCPRTPHATGMVSPRTTGAEPPRIIAVRLETIWKTVAHHAPHSHLVPKEVAHVSAGPQNCGVTPHFPHFCPVLL